MNVNIGSDFLHYLKNLSKCVGKSFHVCAYTYLYERDGGGGGEIMM